MIDKLKEPIKYEQVHLRGRNEWRVTQEWKDWRKQIMSHGFQKHNATKKTKSKAGRRELLTPENHKPIWKEAASVPGSERKIYFCTCLSESGNSYAGCGAVAIQTHRGGPMTIAVEPRFE